jgi:hypothetical protein
LSINTRISKLIELLENNNQRAFCKKSNIPATTLQGIIGKRQSDPAAKILNCILVSYPHVNARWLITGEGEMFGDVQSDTSVLIEPNASIAYKKNDCDMCDEKERLVNYLESQIIDLKADKEILTNDREWLKRQLECPEYTKTKRRSA